MRGRLRYIFTILVFVPLSLVQAAREETSTSIESLPAPGFSSPPGFHANALDLEIDHPHPQVRIYYTLDGSLPDPASLQDRTFRYKNRYQLPPGQPADDFLQAVSKTYEYTGPVSIPDGRQVADRWSQINTTWDENPVYFPEPAVDEKYWLSRLTGWLNGLIGAVNNSVNRINKELNRAGRSLHKAFRGEAVALSGHHFIPRLPLVPYRKYLQPREYLYKGMVVRAVAVAEDGRRSPVTTGTFFAGQRDFHGLPVLALTVPPEQLYAYDEGIFVAGRDYDEWLLQARENGDNTDMAANWNRKTRLPALLEVFNTANDSTARTAQLRLHGAWSRSGNTKSMHLGKLQDELDLFSRHGDRMVAGSLLLRNSGQDMAGHYYYDKQHIKTMFKDGAIQRIAEGLNFAVQRYQPAVVFMNGEYHGLLNIRDRLDAKFLQQAYRLPTRKVDLIKGRDTVQAGSMDAWQQFLERIDRLDMQAVDAYALVAGEIDMESFLDYTITEVFIANHDWPHNNIRYWRYHGKPVAATAADGRWRWILFDTDAAGGWNGSSRNYRYDALAIAAGRTGDKPEWSTRLLRRLLENAQFREEFIRRFADLLNTHFQPRRTLSILAAAQDDVAAEIPDHLRRWAGRGLEKYWQQAVDELFTLFAERPAVQRQQLEKFFALPGQYRLQLAVNDGEAGTIRLNTLHLGLREDELPYSLSASSRASEMRDVLALPWQGDYFSRQALAVKAVARPGYRFSHWETAGSELSAEASRHAELQLQPEKDLSLKAVFVEAHEHP